MVCLPELLATCLLVWPTKGIPWKEAEEQVSLPAFWLVFRSNSTHRPTPFSLGHHTEFSLPNRPLTVADV